MNDKKKVLLITKLKTTNIGNQALSDELIKLYEQSGMQCHVTGRPEGLFGYSIEKLVKSNDPIALFEKWADGLYNILRASPEESPFKSQIRFVELLSFNDFKVKNDHLFQVIKDVFRRFIHIEFFFAKAFKNRFLTISSADVLVYSGAGEVSDNNIFLRQLLELRIAQKLKKKTFAINQSVEVVKEPMQSICAHVYKHMDQILVRGVISRNNLIQIGVPAEKIDCCPDSAFLNPTPPSGEVRAIGQHYEIKRPSVGINVIKAAYDLAKWGEIITALKNLGYFIYFISNDPFGDKQIGEKMSAHFGFKAILDFIPYPQYSALLANFNFVISCRLHTNELSLTGGTPIIPIEGSHFKTKEVFSLINYPIPVLNSGAPDWHLQLLKTIHSVHSDSYDLKSFISCLDSVRDQSKQNLIEI